jgi:hypothetical protein
MVILADLARWRLLDRIGNLFRGIVRRGLEVRYDEGALDNLKIRLHDARHKLQRAGDDVAKSRIEGEIAILQQQIGEQSRAVDSPEQEKQQTLDSIERRLEAERTPIKPIRVVSGSQKLINQPPAVDCMHGLGGTLGGYKGKSTSSVRDTSMFV